MKPLIYSFTYIILIFLILSSCAEKEEIINPTIDEQEKFIGDVSFSLTLDNGTDERAELSFESFNDSQEINNSTIGKGQLIDYLYLMALDSKNNPIDFTVSDKNGEYTCHKDSKIIEIRKPFTSSDGVYRLVIPFYAETDKVIFWAQCGKAKTLTQDMPALFDLSSLPVVGIDYKSALNNDESRDAFCAVYTRKHDGYLGVEEIVLQRPFAQVNLGSVLDDFEGAKTDLNLYISETRMEVSGVANRYDLVTGACYFIDDDYFNESTDYPISFEQTPIFSSPNDYLYYLMGSSGSPAEGDTSATPEDTGKLVYEKSRWISMSYFLPLGSKMISSTVNLRFTLAGIRKEKDMEVPYSNILELKNVPVKHNNQTNIVGWIISTKPKIYVQLSPDFNKDSSEFFDPE
ncbi:MAG: hypothetical protein J1F16_01890 [Muribaculaceae bacterium]|nr:hypothetical protein [Muribaculaceae bacterium]